MIAFGRELGDYQIARRKEYLLTTPWSYCSSSLAGNTRKYHGLLVHHNRVALSTLDEFLNGDRISSASYAGQVQAEGLSHIRSFSLYPPRFIYEVEGVLLQKTLLLRPNLQIRYDILGEASLTVVPLIADRSIHETQQELNFSQQTSAHGVRFDHLTLHSDSMIFTEHPDTYWNVWYQEDFERGCSHQEHLHAPGQFSLSGENLSISLNATVPERVLLRGRGKVQSPSHPLGCLYRAADDFYTGETLYAGFHWFVEPWGRDAFVSLPGLLLTRGRFREAERVFRFFQARIRNGLIPNRAPDSFTSSDATLWFLNALKQYADLRESNDFIREMVPCIEELLATYPESGVATLDKDLIAVTPFSTWMDTPFTPREGKPVEVNALWIDALRFACSLDIDPPVSPEHAERSFRRFWNPEKGCLYDCIDPPDPAIRPNQVFAAALGVVDRTMEKELLRTVTHHLLTPVGLRTLSPTEATYRGIWAGDATYHNGCVWPWLMGSYVDALLRHGSPPERLSPLLEPLFAHLYEAGLGSISECFDGDPPYTPRGCISQAWSVGEVIRAAHRIRRAKQGNVAGSLLSV